MLLNIIAGSAENTTPIEYVDGVLALNLFRYDPVLPLLRLVSNYLGIDQHGVDRHWIQLIEVFNKLKCLFYRCVAREGNSSFLALHHVANLLLPLR